MSLYVVAHFRALPGQGAVLETHLAPLVAPTAGEDGCIAYRYYRDNDDPDHIVFFEEWRDDASLDVHLATQHVTGMLAAVAPLLAESIAGYRLTQG